MARYAINSPEIRTLKKVAKKYGKFPIKTKHMEGEIQITGYRKYTGREEVDVIFRGKILAQIGMQLQWFGYEEVVSFGKGVSKVKLNRFLKKNCFDGVRDRVLIFGIDLKYITDLTKVKWTT